MENSFVLLSQFQRQARKAGWEKEKIEKILRDAMSGNRDHLENVLFRALLELEQGVITN